MDSGVRVDGATYSRQLLQMLLHSLDSGNVSYHTFPCGTAAVVVPPNMAPAPPEDGEYTCSVSSRRGGRTWSLTVTADTGSSGCPDDSSGTTRPGNSPNCSDETETVRRNVADAVRRFVDGVTTRHGSGSTP